MLRGFARRQFSGGMLFGPLLVGIAYGLVQALVPGFSLDFLYLQSPFMFAALSGVAMAFACRPVLLRIDWSRPMAMALGVALVMGIGPLGDWAIASVIAALGLGAFPLNLPESGLALLLGAATAGLLMGHLFRPDGGALDAREVWARWRFYPWRRRLLPLGVIALAAVVLGLALAMLDAHQEEAATALYVPLVAPNYWLRMQGLWMTRSVPGALLACTALLVLLWLRAVLLVLPLLPIAMALRGSWAQLTVVFTVLLFVVGEFAPLMVDQPYPSLRWLLLRTGLGLGRAAVLGALTAALYGVIRRDPDPPEAVPHRSDAGRSARGAGRAPAHRADFAGRGSPGAQVRHPTDGGTCGDTTVRSDAGGRPASGRPRRGQGPGRGCRDPLDGRPRSIVGAPGRHPGRRAVLAHRSGQSR